MRVANYYRVSTKLQQDKFSLSAQKSELRDYAKKQGWQLIDEFKDVESGGKLNKEGLDQLLDVVESGKIDVVLVMDQDRLSRLDTLSWEFLKSVLRDNLVKIAEPNGTITDLSNEDDEFLSDLKNLLAQREKRSIVRRMMYGKRQRLREDKGWGMMPFEYYYDKQTSKYYIKDGWDWVIPFIDDLYINHNIGIKSISNRLNEVSKTPTGKKWNETLVHKRLTSKAFHGLQEMNFANGETIAANVYEPMRTEETYNKIQKIRKARASKFNVASRTSNVNIALLKFVPLTCGVCGRKLTVVQMGNAKAPKFNTQHGRTEVTSGERCVVHINAKRYEYNMVKAIRDILTSEELSKKYLNLDFDDDELVRLEKKKKKLQDNIKTLSAAKDKLLDLYLNDLISKIDYVNKTDEIQNKLDIITDQSIKIKSKIDAIKNNKLDYTTVKQYINISKDFGVKLSRHEQANIIGNLFTKGVLTQDKLILTTEVFNGVPIDIKIDVVDCTRKVNRWIKEDEMNDKIIYRTK